MRGLALEGGGARGAYQIGAVKALIENGYEFDGFVGTSIGAINAAILAQGDFDKSLEIWSNMSFELLFEEDDWQILKYTDIKGLKRTAELLANAGKIVSKIKSGGLSTEKLKMFIRNYVDEELIRSSGRDYGLATILINDRKPLELMLEDIPQGQLCDYIMASASYPFFQRETIEEKKFLDGAFYDNCPYNLLVNKGYDEIIIIRTNARGVFRKVKRKDTEKIKVIAPLDDLRPVLLFSQENCAANIKLGYYDGLRYAKNLRGSVYYIDIDPAEENKIGARLMAVPDDIVLETGALLNIPEMPAKRMLFEKIIPQLSAYLKLGKEYDYADFAVAILERMAAQRKIERFHIYDYERLCDIVKEQPAAQKKKTPFQITPLQTIISRRKEAVEILGGGILNN